MKRYKIGTAVATAILMIVSLNAISRGQSDAQQSRPVSVTKGVTVRATIVAIDKDNRIVTLRGPRGRLIDLKADERMRRFDELKVGDVISATYSESVAVQLRKPGEPEPEKERVVVRPQSKPGASIENVRTSTVTVEEIDRGASQVTVKDADGNMRTYRVRDPRRLEHVKVGDNIDVTYTTAVLLKVE